MKSLFDKFWNDGEFVTRMARGLFMAGGLVVASGALDQYIPREAAIGIGAVMAGGAGTFSGGKTR
jgi:hypothetical protein